MACGLLSQPFSGKPASIYRPEQAKCTAHRSSDPSRSRGVLSTRPTDNIARYRLESQQLPSGAPRSRHPSMQQLLPWILASLSLALLLGAAVLWMLHGRKARPRPLPTEWTLTPRPVFNTDERRVYRQLREALPHHVLLSKLPLVRFCQPVDPDEVRYWYELLGSINVTFAICSANGRVLAAIDLEIGRAHV